ncbi:hypothetical protein FNW02_29285 [Komarekiella sp. 'clone 1']|uniref:Uncharacterized protein n=1 Tax=Komarekiella delphini-convector SJRDD-AB1 TaxID=2593771 RepID=A0AA40T387_9NOST|nr:hypothetical protein [Komarekiella delphini-convector SJRDD-AB1]
MLPLEPLFCPCCTPAILHLLTQSELAQHILQLRTGSVAAAIKKNQKQQQQSLSVAGQTHLNIDS